MPLNRQRKNLKPIPTDIVLAIILLCLTVFAIFLIAKAGFNPGLIVLFLPGVAFCAKTLVDLLKEAIASCINNKINFISLKSLRCFSKLRPNCVFLGYGFEFTGKHSRYLHDYLESGACLGEGAQNGLNFIHRTEFRNNVQLFVESGLLTGHAIIFGAPGSGKTRLLDLLIAQAIMRNDAVFVIDPKGDGELMNKCRKICSLHKGELAFVNVDLCNPGTSDTFNLFGSSSSCADIADKLSALMTGGGSAESFKNYAREALYACLIALNAAKKNVTLQNLGRNLGGQAVFLEAIEAICTARSKKKRQTDDSDNPNAKIPTPDEEDADLSNTALSQAPITQLDGKARHARLLIYKHRYDQEIKNDPSGIDLELEALFAMVFKNQEFQAKVTSGILPVLSALTAGELGSLFSGKFQESSCRKVVENAQVMYASLHFMKNITAGTYVGKLLLSDLCSLAGDIYAKRFKTKRRVTIVVDEAAEMASEALLQLLNKARGAGFSLILAAQNYDDLAGRCGSDAFARQIIGNCNSLISLRVKNELTARTVVSALPQIKTLGQSGSFGKNLLLNHSKELKPINWTLTENLKPLFPQAALGLLPNFEFVALLADGRFIKAVAPILKLED